MHLVYYLMLLVAIGCFKGNSSVEVTPAGTVQVCPGELVVFKCTTSTTLLQWTVTLANKSRAPFELLLSPSIAEAVSEAPATNLVLRAEWISLSPPCSTFMTNASLALHNAQVKCTSAGSSDTSTIIMKDTPAITQMNITKTFFGQDSAIVVVEWNDVDGNQSINSGSSFLVMITPPVYGSMSNFTTNTSSYQLIIPYNSQHTLTVTATNCVGNTSTLNKTINITQCKQPPMFSQNFNVSVKFAFENTFLLEGSQAFFSCPQGQALSNSTFTSAICTSSGEWYPEWSRLNLQCDYVEDDNLILITIIQEKNPLLISIVVLCTLILLVGIVSFVSVIIIILKRRVSQGSFRGKEGDSEVGNNADIIEEYCGRRNQSHSDYSNTTEVEVIPGSGKLAPNSSYELTRVPRAQLVEIKRNPAYISIS